jgi:hypothetical protein
MSRPAASLALIPAIVMMGGSAVASAEAVTYDFVGKVMATYGDFAGLENTAFSGSFTLDFSEANPAQSAGNPASSASWTYRAEGGSLGASTMPLPTGSVFSQQFTLNGVTYASALAGMQFAGTVYTGGNAGGNVSGGSSTITADLMTEMALEVYLPTGSAYTAYLSNGLLNLDNLGPMRGRYETHTLPGYVPQSLLLYQITSVTASSAVPSGGVPVPLSHTPTVPLPAAVWLLASGLGLLGAVARRSRDQKITLMM